MDHYVKVLELAPVNRKEVQKALNKLKKAVRESTDGATKAVLQKLAAEMELVNDSLGSQEQELKKAIDEVREFADKSVGELATVLVRRMESAQNEVDRAISGLNSALEGVKGSVEGVRGESEKGASEITTRLTGLKKELATLKGNVTRIKNDPSLNELKKEIGSLEFVKPDELGWIPKGFSSLQSDLSMVRSLLREFAEKKDDNLDPQKLQELEDRLRADMRDQAERHFPIQLPGTPGSEVFVGSGSPDHKLGKNTDVYFDVDTGTIYKKIDGRYASQGTLVDNDTTHTYKDVIAFGDESTDHETGTAVTFYSPPYAITLTDIEASLVTAPVGSTFIVDLHDDGTTVMSTDKCDIEASEFHTKDAATQPAITAGSIAANSKMEIIVDQIGSSTAGAGGKLYLYYTVD
jgi:hypothetical protein